MSIFKNNKQKKVEFEVVGGDLFEEVQSRSNRFIRNTVKGIEMKVIAGKNFKGDSKNCELTNKKKVLKTILKVALVISLLVFAYSILKIFNLIPTFEVFMESVDYIQPLN